MPKRTLVAGIVAVLLVGAAVALLGERVDAHPSPLESLTLDFLLDQSGLVVIDGAANRATYDDAPAPAEREVIAGQVVDALGIPGNTVQVDGESSSLYHEVGFRISLHAAFANGGAPGVVRIDTAPLQAIAAGLGTLTLDVCRIAAPGPTLAVEATSPPTSPDPAGAGAPDTDRTECHTWVLRADDPPVVVTGQVDGANPEPRVRARVTLPCGAPSTGDPTFVVTPPVARQSGTLPAHATGVPSSHLLQADAVLEFSTRTRIDLVVPKPEIGHLSFGPDAGPRATRRLTVPECKYDQASPWTVSGIRIWVDEAACVPITVTTPRTRRTVRLAVGAPCDPEAR